jgi:transcriptional regulator GlxA family with amidase domain
MAPLPIRIALLAYDGMQTLDLAGPLDAFDSANALQPGAYETRIVSLDGATVASEAGLRLCPDAALDAAGAFDTLILPGGAGLRVPGVADRLAGAIADQAPGLRRIVSVCTGIYGLAPSGLADGRRVTTHWKFAADVASRFPALRLEPDAIFVKDGPIYTSAGITAAIDLALALIEEDYGPALALAAARDLVVYLKRSGGQRQYSEPLRFQARAGDRFADLAAYMVGRLDADLSVEALAARAHLSPRQFSRAFKAAFRTTPAQHVERLRLDAARDHLIASTAGVDQIARTVGFHSDDAFRRAFDRRFGLSPTEYRRRFARTNTNDANDPDFCHPGWTHDAAAQP